MKIKERFNQFMQGTIDTKVAIIALLLIWAVAVVAIAGVALAPDSDIAAAASFDITGPASQPLATTPVDLRRYLIL